MSKKSNGQVADGSNVHPRRDDDSTVLPPERSRDWDYPDLAAVVAAWPELPDAIRTGIVAMVKAARS